MAQKCDKKSLGTLENPLFSFIMFFVIYVFVLQEVVYATAADLSKLPYDGLVEGFYLVGSGNTGVAASLAAIGQ